MAKLLQLYLQGAQNPLKLELEDPALQFRSSVRQRNLRKSSMEDCYSGNCQKRNVFSSGKKRDLMMETARSRRSLSSQQKTPKGIEPSGNSLLDESLLKRTSTQCTPKREKLLLSRQQGQFDTINIKNRSALRCNTEQNHNQRTQLQSTCFSSDYSSIDAISTQSQNNSEKEVNVKHKKIYQGWMKNSRVSNDGRYSKWHESYDGNDSRTKNIRMNYENKGFQENDRKEEVLGRNIESFSLESKQSYSGLLCSLSPKQQTIRGVGGTKHRLLFCNTNKKDKRVVQSTLYEPQNLDSAVNLSKKKTKLIIRPIKQANSITNTSFVQNEVFPNAAHIHHNSETQVVSLIDNSEAVSPWQIPVSTVKTRDGFQSKRISVAFREHYGKSCRYHNQQQQQQLQHQDSSGKISLAIKNCSFTHQENFESLCQLMINAEGSNTPEFIFSSANFKRQHPPIKVPFFKC